MVSERTNLSSYLACTLGERVAALKPNSANIKASKADMGQVLLNRWKARSAFSDKRNFQDFLDSYGLSEDQFCLLLGQSGQDVQSLGIAPPAFVDFLQLCMASEPETGSGTFSESTDNIFDYDALRILGPAINHYKKLLEACAEQLLSAGGSRPFDVDIVNSLLRPFRWQLRSLLVKTFVLEMNIASRQGKLEGASPEDRYQSFIRMLASADVRKSILNEYPVLARKCMQSITNWYQASREFLERLFNDYDDLLNQFAIPRQKVVKANGGAGDSHKGGRSVHILEFEDGTKLVYKPRPLAADCQFQALIEYLNNAGLSPELRTLQVLDRQDYGWMEFATHQTCSCKQELERFYERTGILLAVLYLTASSDVHMENLVASGEHPLVIDLEVVFNPRRSAPIIESVEDIARLKCSDSVTLVGLLPAPYSVENLVDDGSALGGKANRELPYYTDGLVDTSTDKMRVEKVPARRLQTNNSPLLNGETVEAFDYRDEIEQGFRTAYNLFMKLKDELLSGTSILENFRKVPVRVVVRPTAHYLLLLGDSQHPMVNGNALDQELVFSEFWRTSQHTRASLQTIMPEIRQILSGDVPYFLYTPESTTITGADGTKIEHAVETSGFAVALDHIKRMNESDREWQVWLIDATLSTMSSSKSSMLWRQGYPCHCASLLDAAIACGDRLIETSIAHASQTTWNCLNYADESEIPRYVLGTPSYGLYNGLPGIALFLAYLHKETGNMAYHDLARKVINLVLRRVDVIKGNGFSGAFSGLSGFVYVLMHLATLFQDEKLWKAGLNQLEDLSDLIQKDTHIDIISGNAGCLLALLAVSKIHSDCQAKELAIQCGDRILALAEPGKYAGGLYWKSLRFARGFAHGLSGIACALSELAHATGDERYYRACQAALCEERGYFSEGTWADNPENPQQVAWCHGAPGVALSRMRIFEKHMDVQCREDALAALQFVLDSPQPRGSSNTICHGTLGNLEPFLVAAEIFSNDKDKWLAEVSGRSQAILADMNESGWKSALPPHLAEPGLMTGLSGIGYGMLRSLAPRKVPSVLLLDPPAGL